VLAQLIDAETGVNLWSYAYDLELNGILATQREISRDMAVILQPQIAHLVYTDAHSTTT
jgi:TolB-like protein